MPCTTILVGKNASYDGSTMIARNDDSGSGHFTPKKFIAMDPAKQPKVYTSELSHVKIQLPEDPMRYTAVPNALNCRRYRRRRYRLHCTSLYHQCQRGRKTSWLFAGAVRHL